ncbi:hypothetical protein AgCh_011706 [Apium graveolens]
MAKKLTTGVALSLLIVFLVSAVEENAPVPEPALSPENKAGRVAVVFSELASSIQSLNKSAMEELHIFGEVKKALLTATSSDGAGAKYT